MKLLKIVGVLLALLLLVIFLGPRPEFPSLESPKIERLGISLDSLDRFVQEKDLSVSNLKPDNQSMLFWADSLRKTPYSVVYLHGFSASPMESGTFPIEFAKDFGFNLYMPLLAEHGRNDRESFVDLTPNDLIVSAKQAIAVGQLIGENVIVMSCSTGSTLSIYLAGANHELIDVLMMYSPNIAIKDPTAAMITGPWGKQLLKAVSGDYWNPNGRGEGDALKYWTTTYRTEGLIALQSLLDQTMTTEVFGKVTQPMFVGYYHKNEEENDPTISTDAIQDFIKSVATPKSFIVDHPFPNAGAHVITNPIKAENVHEVKDATYLFMTEKLKVYPRTQSLLELN